MISKERDTSKKPEPLKALTKPWWNIANPQDYFLTNVYRRCLPGIESLAKGLILFSTQLTLLQVVKTGVA